jgi:hypothetical protein
VQWGWEAARRSPVRYTCAKVFSCVSEDRSEVSNVTRRCTSAPTPARLKYVFLLLHSNLLGLYDFHFTVACCAFALLRGRQHYLVSLPPLYTRSFKLMPHQRTLTSSAPSRSRCTHASALQTRVGQRTNSFWRLEHF